MSPLSDCSKNHRPGSLRDVASRRTGAIGQLPPFSGRLLPNPTFLVASPSGRHYRRVASYCLLNSIVYTSLSSAAIVTNSRRPSVAKSARPMRCSGLSRNRSRGLPPFNGIE